MQVIDQRTQIANLAMGVGILQQRAEHLVLFQVIHRVDDQLETETFGTGLHHGNGLRMTVFIDEEQIASGLGDTLGQGHRFRCRRGFVQQRGVGQLQAGEVDGQLLEIQQRFESTLGDLGLIRRVSGVPTGIFQDVTQDDSRRQRAVVAHADQAGPDLVLLGVATQFGQRGFFVEGGWQVKRPVQANSRRHCLLDQFDSAADTETVEHRLLLGGIGA